MKDAPSFFELLDLRLLVETFCVRSLAASASHRSFDRLKGCLVQMERSTGSLSRFGKKDIAFHLTLVEEAGHGLFSNIMRGLLPGLGVRFALETYTEPKLIKKNLADHRAIFRHIQCGDSDAAEARLRIHLLRSRRHLESML
ncbi:MAG: FadR/GntR family transcriptional regulator [Terrimicrobiaceae bacterium]